MALAQSMSDYQRTIDHLCFCKRAYDRRGRSFFAPLYGFGVCLFQIVLYLMEGFSLGATEPRRVLFAVGPVLNEHV